MSFNGSSYAVAASATAFVPPASSSLTDVPPVATSTPGRDWDDALAAPITLPFSFPFPGGSTSTIQIGSNGIVFLGAATHTLPYGGDPAAVLAERPSLAPAYCDLDLALGGTLHYDIEPVSGAAIITFLRVPPARFVPPRLVTFQVHLHPTGHVDFVFQVGPVQPAVFTGFSSGRVSPDPGSTDISANLPFTSGNGTMPPYLDVEPEPSIGSTINFATRGIRPGSPFNVLLLGTDPLDPGIELAFLGMPGCHLHVLPMIVLTTSVDAGGNSFVALSLPNDPGLVGLPLVAQSAPFTAGFNPLGLVASNGVIALLGN